MSKYRKFMNEMDYDLKLDGGTGYVILTTFVLWMSMILTYGVWLEITY